MKGGVQPVPESDEFWDLLKRTVFIGLNDVF